jgi:acyl carrier protein
MDADLDIEYDMDSTEMTEFAKKIEQKYGISIQRSERQDWVSGSDICKFVARKLADSAVTV